jgi:protein TonB
MGSKGYYSMQHEDIFTNYIESCEEAPVANGNNGNTRKNLFFAISASLALHIGIAIILTTATAMSFGLKLWEDPVLHVSLVSAPEMQKTDKMDVLELKKESVPDRQKVIEPHMVIKPTEKENREKVTTEQVTSRVAEMKQTIVASSQPSNLGTKTVSAASYTTMSNNSMAGNSFAGISLAVPRYRENAHPVYPLVARLRGYEGVVLLSAEVSVDGRVGGLKIKRSSGYTALDRSALEAVKTWKFEPGRKMGKPTGMWVDVPVKFLLKDSEQM